MPHLPKHHAPEPISGYMGEPVRNCDGAVFFWREPVIGRPATRAVPIQKTGPKSVKDILAVKVAGAISFSKNTQADADNNARIAGRKNHSRSE